MVNLTKGQRVNLRKDDGTSLNHLLVGLGWQEANGQGFFGKLFGLFNSHTSDIDIDSTVFCCKNGQLVDSDDVVYFGNLRHDSGAIRHMGDDLTGGGDIDADNEQIFIDLNKLPNDYDKLVFVVNIYEAKRRSQDFGQIRHAFIRIVDNDTQKEMVRYNLSDNYDGKTALIVGEVCRINNKWSFKAIGEATTDGSISELMRRYRV